MFAEKGCRAIVLQVVRLLHEERERRKLSMYEVAGRSGLSPQMVSYVGREMRNPSLETVLRMADAIEVDLAELITKASKAAPKRGK